MSTTTSAPSAPRGILKTSASGAAKREDARMRALDAARQEIHFKVLVLGGDGAGKSSLIRMLRRESRSSAPLEHAPSIDTCVIAVQPFRERNVYLHLWEVPLSELTHTQCAARAGLPFSWVHAAVCVLDGGVKRTGTVAAPEDLREGDEEEDEFAQLSAVDVCRDEVEARIMRWLPEGVSSFPLFLLGHKADGWADGWAEAYIRSRMATTGSAGQVAPAGQRAGREDGVASCGTEADGAHTRSGKASAARDAATRTGDAGGRKGLLHAVGSNLSALFTAHDGASGGLADEDASTRMSKKRSGGLTSARSGTSASTATVPTGPPSGAACGLDTADLEAYAESCGYTSFLWTSVCTPSGGTPTAAMTFNVQVFLSTLVDEMLEGDTDGQLPLPALPEEADVPF